MNILAIGAHPDDIELGCGGTLVKAARNGHNVYMCTLTRGAASGDPRERTQELLASGKYIGAKDVAIGDFDDTKLNVDDRLINFIESYINKVDPDVIFTHYHGDIHHDHRAVATATRESARFNSNVLAYEIPLTRDFEPKVYHDISDVIDDKIELIRIYWSQRGKLYTKANTIKALAEFRALQSRLNTSINYVEAFDVLKLCVDNEFRLKKVPYEAVDQGDRPGDENDGARPRAPAPAASAQWLVDGKMAETVPLEAKNVLGTGNRESLDIINLILVVCANGTMKTHVMYKCNLNSKQVQDYLEMSLKLQLIEKAEGDSGRTEYRTTEKGRSFTNAYSELMEILEGNTEPRIRPFDQG